MTQFLTENPWGIAFVGILLVTAFGGGWIQTGKQGLLYAAIASLVLCAAALVIERSTITESERIQLTIDRLARLVEKSDLPGILPYLHPEAHELRRLAENDFQRFKIQEVRIKSGMKVELQPQHVPPQAVAEFNVVVVGGDAVSAISDHSLPRFIILTFRKQGDEWKVWHCEDRDVMEGMTNR